MTLKHLPFFSKDPKLFKWTLDTDKTMGQVIYREWFYDRFGKHYFMKSCLGRGRGHWEEPVHAGGDRVAKGLRLHRKLQKVTEKRAKVPK